MGEYCSDKDILSCELKIMSAKSGRVIDVPGGHGPGTVLQQWEYLDNNNQEWFFDDIDGEPGIFKIYSTLGFCMEMVGDQDGSEVQANKWEGDGRDTQKWRVIKEMDELCSCFVIQNKVNGRVITVDGGSIDQGASIRCCDWQQTENQKWFITPIVK